MKQYKKNEKEKRYPTSRGFKHEKTTPKSPRETGSESGLVDRQTPAGYLADEGLDSRTPTRLSHSQVTYTVEQLITWTEQQTEKSLKGKKILIRVGLNNLKVDEKAEVANKLQKATHNLHKIKADFLVSQIPPLYIMDETNPQTYSR